MTESLYFKMQSTARPFAVKTMIVFTDGHRTAGGDPRDSAAAAAAAGIVVHTITFGQGANEDDMRHTAAEAGGNHYHAPDFETLNAIFREIAYSLPVIITE